MSVIRRTFYAVQCDECGRPYDASELGQEFYEWSPLEDALADGWQELSPNRHRCPDCRLPQCGCCEKIARNGTRGWKQENGYWLCASCLKLPPRKPRLGNMQSSA